MLFKLMKLCETMDEQGVWPKSETAWYHLPCMQAGPQTHTSLEDWVDETIALPFCDQLLPPRAEMFVVLVGGLALAHQLVGMVADRTLTWQMTICNVLLGISLYLHKGLPVLLAVKESVTAVGVSAGLLSLLFSATVALGIRRMYQRSLYCYGSDLNLEGMYAGHTSCSNLGDIRKIFTGVSGNGPEQVFRDIADFEKEAAREGARIAPHCRARFFARRWYHEGLKYSAAPRSSCQGRVRSCLQRIVLPAANVTPKKLATSAVGAFIYMLLCFSWIPLVNCPEPDDKHASCPECHIRQGNCVIGLSSTVAVLLFLVLSPNGSNRSSFD